MAQYLQENSVASGLQLPDNNPANSANPPDQVYPWIGLDAKALTCRNLKVLGPVNGGGSWAYNVGFALDSLALNFGPTTTPLEVPNTESASITALGVAEPKSIFPSLTGTNIKFIPENPINRVAVVYQNVADPLVNIRIYYELSLYKVSGLATQITAVVSDGLAILPNSSASAQQLSSDEKNPSIIRHCFTNIATAGTWLILLGTADSGANTSQIQVLSSRIVFTQ